MVTCDQNMIICDKNSCNEIKWFQIDIELTISDMYITIY